MQFDGQIGPRCIHTTCAAREAPPVAEFPTRASENKTRPGIARAGRRFLP